MALVSHPPGPSFHRGGVAHGLGGPREHEQAGRAIDFSFDPAAAPPAPDQAAGNEPPSSPPLADFDFSNLPPLEGADSSPPEAANLPDPMGAIPDFSEDLPAPLSDATGSEFSGDLPYPARDDHPSPLELPQSTAPEDSAAPLVNQQPDSLDLEHLPRIHPT